MPLKFNASIRFTDINPFYLSVTDSGIYTKHQLEHVYARVLTKSRETGYLQKLAQDINQKQFVGTYGHNSQLNWKEKIRAPIIFDKYLSPTWWIDQFILELGWFQLLMIKFIWYTLVLMALRAQFTFIKFCIIQIFLSDIEKTYNNNTNSETTFFRTHAVRVGTMCCILHNLFAIPKLIDNALVNYDRALLEYDHRKYGPRYSEGFHTPNEEHPKLRVSILEKLNPKNTIIRQFSSRDTKTYLLYTTPKQSITIRLIPFLLH